MTGTFTVTPIGHVRSPRTEPLDDDWGAIELDGEVVEFKCPNPDSSTGVDHRAHGELLVATSATTDPEARF